MYNLLGLIINYCAAGAKYDVVVQLHAPPTTAVKALLQQARVKYVIVAEIPSMFTRLSQWVYDSRSNRFSFLKMTQYDMILFFDADVIFYGNPDSLFDKYVGQYDCVTRGDGQSPVNGGFLFVKPSWQAYVDVEDIVTARSFRAWSGFMNVGPYMLRSGKPRKWEFSSSDGYQGMLYYYYFRRPDHPPSLLYGGFGGPGEWTEMRDVAAHFQGGGKPFEKPDVSKLPLDRKKGLLRYQELEAMVVKLIEMASQISM